MKEIVARVEEAIKEMNRKLNFVKTWGTKMQATIEYHDEKIEEQEKRLDDHEATLKHLQGEVAEVKDQLQAKNNGDGSTSTMASSKQSSAKDPCAYKEQDVREVATKWS